MRFAAAALIATLSLSARAKETVRIAFVGPLTGGNSAIGLGGRNSADLAVKLRNQDAKAIYRRLRDEGRMMPDGLTFVSSWVAADLGRCFQLMEADDVTLLQRWIAPGPTSWRSRSCRWCPARTPRRR